MSNEPSIAPGDWGEHVTLLQERLHHLGYYEGSVDGHYGPTTETAVQHLQEACGLEQDGHAQEATWQAIEGQELLHGTAHQETAEASSADTAGRQLSEDGKWWWDGADWQATEAQETAGDAGSVQESGRPELQLSPDGQWHWDGAQWLPTAEGIALMGSPGHAGGFDADALGPEHKQGPLGIADGSHHPGPTSSSTDDTLTGFATGSAELTPEHQAILARIAADLNAKPLISGGYVTLTGGADRRGQKPANQELGQRRAEAARDYLLQLVTDEETRQQIRAYSLGEPHDGPDGDVPSLRKVDIAITRRSYDADLRAHPTHPLPKTGETPWEIPEADKFRYKPPIHPPDPRHPEWPDWFWKEVPKRPPGPSFLSELSAFLNQTIGTHNISRIAARVARAFGLDQAEVERTLDDAFQSGGEDGAKYLLKKLFDKLTELQSGQAPSPSGPPDPIPFPKPDMTTPEIRF